MNDFEWTRLNPLASKYKAHNSAKKLFKEDGVPSKIVIDSARD